MLPLVRGTEDAHRPALLYGTFGQGVCYTDGDWTIFKSPAKDEGLFLYSTQLYRSLVAEEGPQIPVQNGRFIPGVEFPQWQVPTRYRALSREDFLFHRAEDPGQKENLWASANNQRRRMTELLVDLLNEEGLPPEQFDRLGLAIV